VCILVVDMCCFHIGSCTSVCKSLCNSLQYNSTLKRVITVKLFVLHTSDTRVGAVCAVKHLFSLNCEIVGVVEPCLKTYFWRISSPGTRLMSQNILLFLFIFQILHNIFSNYISACRLCFNILIPKHVPSYGPILF